MVNFSVDSNSDGKYEEIIIDLPKISELFQCVLVFLNSQNQSKIRDILFSTIFHKYIFINFLIRLETNEGFTYHFYLHKKTNGRNLDNFVQCFR